jgi:CRISPR-associated protein Cmr4
MNTKLLFILTRTPLHVGAGVIGGLVDRPVLRERHTGQPVIPGTTLKGVFASEWSASAGEAGAARNPEGAWLFGTSTAGEESGVAGAMQFTEARLLAFPCLDHEPADPAAVRPGWGPEGGEGGWDGGL